MKYVLLHISICFVTISAAAQSRLAFLKNDAAVQFTDLENSSGQLLIKPGTYFRIEAEKDGKALIYGWGQDPKKPNETGLGRNYVDTSLIEEFDSLNEAEKKQHIRTSFHRFSNVLRSKSRNVYKEYIYEAVYSPMVAEFEKLWIRKPEKELFKLWIPVIELNGGSAEGLESRTLFRLFSAHPYTFSSVVKLVPDHLDYIEFRLENAIATYSSSEQERMELVVLFRKYFEN